MKPTSRTVLHAALTAAFLFVATATAPAQGLVSLGRGSYASPADPQTVSQFSYFLTDRGNGAAHGYAIWSFPATTIVVRVTSFGFFDLPQGGGTTTALAFAGPIVAVLGTPTNPNAVVGRTVFTVFDDDGRHADQTIGLNHAPLPSQVPPIPGIGDLTTIQQIALLLPFFPPPVWTPLLAGDVWIR